MFKVTTHEPLPLSWWYEQFLLGRVDLDPPYQRRSMIWSRWKRAHLIDSILNDFDVPKFYVADFVNLPSSALNKDRRAYALIDGKQRFQSIFDFFEDKFPLNPTFVLDDDPDLPLARMTYSQLKREHYWVVERLEQFLPTVMSVLTDKNNKIEELFVRLNSGEAATGAERRNAMTGPVTAIVREISLHPFFQRRISFSTKRMEEHNLIAKLMLLEHRRRFVDTKAKNLDAFVKEAAEWEKLNPDAAASGVNQYTDARDRVVRVLDLLANEFIDKDPLLKSAGNIPLYYWMAREDPVHVNEIRDFLLAFTEEVLAEMRSQRQDPSRGNAELMSYYTMSRTTNDQSSLEGRYNILQRRFKSFLKPAGGKRV